MTPNARHHRRPYSTSMRGTLMGVGCMPLLDAASIITLLHPFRFRVLTRPQPEGDMRGVPRPVLAEGHLHAALLDEEARVGQRHQPDLRSPAAFPHQGVALLRDRRHCAGAELITPHESVERLGVELYRLALGRQEGALGVNELPAAVPLQEDGRGEQAAPAFRRPEYRHV